MRILYTLIGCLCIASSLFLREYLELASLALFIGIIIDGCDSHNLNSTNEVKDE